MTTVNSPLADAAGATHSPTRSALVRRGLGLAAALGACLAIALPATPASADTPSSHVTANVSAQATAHADQKIVPLPCLGGPWPWGGCP